MHLRLGFSKCILSLFGTEEIGECLLPKAGQLLVAFLEETNINPFLFTLVVNNILL